MRQTFNTYLRHVGVVRILVLLVFLLIQIYSIAETTWIDSKLKFTVISEENATVSVTKSTDTISGEIVIPDTVTKNGKSYSVTAIANQAFYYCVNLTSVTISNSVVSIGDYAFGGCGDLASITIPDSVTSIGCNAFGGCCGLTDVTIGNSVTSIGDDAFAYCESLTSITIPSSVTSIGNDVFYNCINLKAIYSLPPAPAKVESETFNYVDKKNCKLYVPVKSPDIYKTAYGWKDFVNIIGWKFQNNSSQIEVQT